MRAGKYKLIILERVGLFIVFLLMLIGVTAALMNKKWFLENYVVEDGFLENVTVLPLAVLFIASLTYLYKHARTRNLWFFLTYLIVAAGSLFILGEEISWGQRIFDFETTKYFDEHNSQDEMNLHNLVIDGKRVNKIIFTNLLGAGVFLYLSLLPLLYQRKPGFKTFIDRTGIPIPRLYQVLCCLLVFLLSFLTFDPKGAELLEFGACWMFMLIVLFPLNAEERSRNRAIPVANSHNANAIRCLWFMNFGVPEDLQLFFQAAENIVL